MNISSVVLRTKPTDLEKTVIELEKSDLYEVHATDAAGRIVVVMECKDTDEAAERFKKLQEMVGVVSADLSFSFDGDPDDLQLD